MTCCQKSTQGLAPSTDTKYRAGVVQGESPGASGWCADCTGGPRRRPAAASGATRSDLVVSSVGKPPASIAAGKSFNASDKTANSGSGTAGSSNTGYFLSADATA